MRLDIYFLPVAAIALSRVRICRRRGARPAVGPENEANKHRGTIFACERKNSAWNF